MEITMVFDSFEGLQPVLYYYFLHENLNSEPLQTIYT